ncbi:MAG: DUF6134 family protein [Geminicoccaceae bacterium]|nr:DUF6134 family protein [Geminicoccaceae bacterium]MCS7269153.1 DUF6134 family protein [Geminicoccaceae bacterium]MCX7631269.1 DUF6134 family protein [Geminicoccaceae bacterium]MDW8125299.1 DUF6134 family protein [Geminicoccaceae bacterium]MDW8342458.1 DUF6134 family protein [Geminicoccaceae bacterium]
MRADAISARCDRRRMVGGLCAWGVLVAHGRSVRASEILPEDRHFAVFRKGEEIGTHRVVFRAGAAGLEVVHEIDLAVRFAGIPFYRYRQRAQDLWREGRLIASESETDDNGERTRVVLRERGGRLRCDGPSGVFEVAKGTMTDLSYWNPAILAQRVLVSARRGELSPFLTVGGTDDLIEVRGRPTRARRWDVVLGEADNGVVWYDEKGRIVKALVRTRGQVLDYRLL